jgi:two-component system response regulator HupR/HoxA
MALPPEVGLGTVLVVDDETHSLGSLCYLLDETFRVRSASTVASAVRVLESDDVDVVLTDYEMPQSSGLVLLERVEKKHPEIVRILMTAHASYPEVVAARRKGRVFEVMAKPLDPDHLVGALERAVVLAKSRKTARR